MKIKILGTRGEVKATAPRHSKHSGVLVDGKLLFDVGEKEFLQYRPRLVFITHLHPDHAFFIRKKSVAAPVVRLYTPQNLKRAITVGAYKIKPILTRHGKDIKSSAYLIKKGKKKVLYTGDLIWINKTHYRYLKNLDLVITEGSFIRSGGFVRKDPKSGRIYGHTGIPNLIQLFKKFTNRIVFVHFGSWFYENIGDAKRRIKNLGKEEGMETIAGYDGANITI